MEEDPAKVQGPRGDPIAPDELHAGHFPADNPRTVRQGMPTLLTVSCVLVGVQAASLLSFAENLLTLTTGQRMFIDEASGGAEGGVPSLAAGIGAGVLGVSMVGLIVMLARRSRLGRWLTAALEVLILLSGLVLLSPDLATGFFDAFNVGITAGTVLAPALILFALIVSQGSRRYFKVVPATPNLLSV